MQKKYFLSAFLTILFISAIIAQKLPYKKETRDGKEYYIYKVEAHEGLMNISRKFNVSQEEIVTNNPETKSGVKVDQILKIPIKKQSVKNDESLFFYHTVESGETITSIALMYGVSVTSIKKLNPEIEQGVKIGCTIKIPQTVHVPEETGEEIYQYHTIAPRETLLLLAKKYNLTVQEILDANPDLSADNFQIGKVIRIDIAKSKKQQQQQPAVKEPKFIDYVVRKSETMYSISRKFDLPVDSLLILNPNLRGGLLLGSTIQVPAPITVAKKSVNVNNIKDLVQISTNAESTPVVLSHEKIKVALMLPFMVDETGEEASKQSRRFIEYYEGFLLAIEKLKAEGVSIELFVYDTGSETKSINKILKQPELEDMQLIIGPVYNEHIAPTTEFAKAHKIPMVIPFTSKNDDVLTNSNILQVNTPHSYLYSEASSMFVRKFKNSQIIFLEKQNKVGDKSDFITVLKNELKRRTIPYKTFTSENPDDVEQIAQMLSPDQENVIVPVSGSSNDLKEIMPALQSIAINQPNIKISLFGYPEWQTYVKDYMDAFYNLNTYIYSTFFANQNSPEYKEFSTNFRHWYQREIINSYPKYGVLGYDTGIYFLQTLATNNNSFDQNIKNKNYHGIQTGFSFERVNNWSGYINKNVYLINYGRNHEITKLISDK